MRKEEFLRRLNALLSDLGEEERREALTYYEEYFADAGVENEAEILSALGSPEQVAEQIRAGLSKEEEGLFTESGYRKKAESDNPPDVYGRKAGEKNRWKEKEKKESGKNSAAGQKKKKNMDNGTIILLVILGILASPVILVLGAAVLAVAFGILCTAFGILLAIGAVVIAFLVTGIILLVSGIPVLIVRPFAGILYLAVGCFMIAAFLLSVTLLVAIFGKFFPWLIREVESFGKYLKRKWSAGKKGGEPV